MTKIILGRDEMLSAVRALGLPGGQYTVFGRGPLVVRGMVRSDHITIVVTEGLFRRLAATDGWDAHRAEDGLGALRRGSFEAVDRIEVPGYHRSGQALIAASERIYGVPVVRLTELRALLGARRGEQDQSDIALVRRALRDEVLRERHQRVSHRTQVATSGSPSPPAEGTWEGNGWQFLVRALTSPPKTFAAARGISFWRTACGVGLAVTVLGGLAQAVHGDIAPPWIRFLPLLLAPATAGLGLLATLLLARIALHVARPAGGSGDHTATASQAAIVGAVWGLPTALASLAFGSGPLTGIGAVFGVVLAVGIVIGVVALSGGLNA